MNDGTITREPDTEKLYFRPVPVVPGGGMDENNRKLRVEWTENEMKEYRLLLH